MDVTDRIENSLETALAPTLSDEAPPQLAEAMRYAVLNGGKRVRPRLCLGVATCCGDDMPELSNAAATAIELLHCASLVHDDMPCFDDAVMRRGKPSVHRAFGESIALLTGDALIVLAFETLAAQIPVAPDRAAAIISIVGRAVGMPYGIVAGQGWESESEADFAAYRRAKTGALFGAVTAAGAAAAGANDTAWYMLGERLGDAYQVADDISDVASDTVYERPNAVNEFGLRGAQEYLRATVKAALDDIPQCSDSDLLRDLILAESSRLTPDGVAQTAA